MKTQKLNTKLKLQKMTVSNLEEKELDQVRGGQDTDPRGTRFCTGPCEEPWVSMVPCWETDGCHTIVSQCLTC